uniref:citrate-binding protein-like n=1 Tax=Erigeron canadensis TaxID=72917 RepID=UPI001CB8A1FC|nr:citrate-binding protein-like [Erigeron canadensis]
MHQIEHYYGFVLALGAILLSRHTFGAHSHIINDLTLGFTRLPFNKTYYVNHKPYNLPLEDRYSLINGVHKLWVFSTDEPLYQGSTTNPRSELFINGYKYSTGVWQFEAHAFVPNGTSGVSLMQVFGGDPHSTTLMVRVYDGNLYYYREKVIFRNIYDKWFRLNVIHDVEGNSVKVYINGVLKFKGHGRGGTTHYFKCGVYAQDCDSFYMESRWKNIKILEKCN